MNRCIVWLLYFTVCVYSLLDAYQTKLLIELGAREVNPLLSWIMNFADVLPALLCVKLPFLIGLGVLLIVERN